MSNDQKKDQENNARTEAHAPEIHVYDGIEEHDNQLPRWWVSLLYLTIVFSAGYFVYYEMAGGLTIRELYERDHRDYEIAEMVRAQQAEASLDEGKLTAAVASPERRNQGKDLFQSKCVSCHGAQGQGGIGPNLTDKAWIHGGKPIQIVKVIANGVLDKGMPPWKGSLKQEEVVSLAAYIRSIGGSNPPGARAPQGTVTE